MTGKIFTLDDFRRDDAERAKISVSAHEHDAPKYPPQTAGQLPLATLADPFPKDWGEFWRASAFWSRRQATDVGPTPESWRQVSTYPER
jgi:hypothetical protein